MIHAHQFPDDVAILNIGNDRGIIRIARLKNNQYV